MPFDLTVRCAGRSGGLHPAAGHRCLAPPPPVGGGDPSGAELTEAIPARPGPVAPGHLTGAGGLMAGPAGPTTSPGATPYLLAGSNRLGRAARLPGRLGGACRVRCLAAAPHGSRHLSGDDRCAWFSAGPADVCIWRSNLGRAPLGGQEHEPVGLVEGSSVAAGEEDSARRVTVGCGNGRAGSGSRRGEPLGAGRGAGSCCGGCDSDSSRARAAGHSFLVARPAPGSGRLYTDRRGAG